MPQQLLIVVGGTPISNSNSNSYPKSNPTIVIQAAAERIPCVSACFFFILFSFLFFYRHFVLQFVVVATSIDFPCANCSAHSYPVAFPCFPSSCFGFSFTIFLLLLCVTYGLALFLPRFMCRFCLAFTLTPLSNNYPIFTAF